MPADVSSTEIVSFLFVVSMPGCRQSGCVLFQLVLDIHVRLEAWCGVSVFARVSSLLHANFGSFRTPVIYFSTYTFSNTSRPISVGMLVR